MQMTKGKDMLNPGGGPDPAQPSLPSFILSGLSRVLALSSLRSGAVLPLLHGLAVGSSVE